MAELCVDRVVPGDGIGDCSISPDREGQYVLVRHERDRGRDRCRCVDSYGIPDHQLGRRQTVQVLSCLKGLCELFNRNSHVNNGVVFRCGNSRGDCETVLSVELLRPPLFL